MRKKSHISLAMYIVDSLAEQELSKHKRAFYLGSILPDCKPSFITTKHAYDGTFLMVQEEIKRLAEATDICNRRTFYKDLGQIIHYIADYFTFPHNKHYEGNLKDHCIYEEKLKKSLREYIHSGAAIRDVKTDNEMDTAQDICNFIQKAHGIYVNIKTDVEKDCQMIVSLCQQVAKAIMHLFHIRCENLPAVAI
jgi:hypothetical protein